MRAWVVRYAGGSWGGREALQASGNQPNDPMVAIDPCGHAVAIWSEYEAGLKRVWANRYEMACSGGERPEGTEEPGQDPGGQGALKSSAIRVREIRICSPASQHLG